MISAISAYLESLVLIIVVNNLPMEDTSVMPRYESGFYWVPFLFVNRKKVQHSGIIPLSNILLNSSTYTGRNKCMVHFIYSFTTISYPGAFPFFIYLAAKRTSFSVI